MKCFLYSIIIVDISIFLTFFDFYMMGRYTAPFFMKNNNRTALYYYISFTYSV